MNNFTFIYALKEEKTDIIRYVGKSNNPEKRLRQHIKNYENHKSKKTSWINSVLRKGRKIELLILEKVFTDDWQEREIYWINFYKNEKLTNCATGGKGGSTIIYKESYEFVKKWVSSNLLNIISARKWYEYIKINQLPEFIPSNPKEVYEKRGWISWGDFLGTHRIQDNKRINYISYNDSKDWIIKNNIVCSTSKDWKKIKKPSFIPNRPNRYYKNRGWISWGDFLSNDRVANRKKEFLDYESCKKWILENLPEIKTVTKWRNYSITKGFPNFIPSNPDKAYKDTWNGWTKFLDKENK